MARLADRTSRIAGSSTQAVTTLVDRLRRAGVQVIDFGAGEPDFPTVEVAKVAAHQAIDANFTKYTPNAGYTGPDSFSYRVSNNLSPACASNAATVSITVCGVTANNDTANV